MKRVYLAVGIGIVFIYTERPTCDEVMENMGAFSVIQEVGENYIEWKVIDTTKIDFFIKMLCEKAGYEVVDDLTWIIRGNNKIDHTTTALATL